MKGKKERSKIASTAKIGEKGQIVIPKNIRDMFGFKPGDTIIIMADGKRGIAIPPKSLFEEVAKKIFDESDEDNNEIDETE